MRMVQVIITYDMDDEGKGLETERQDWLEGRVSIQDIVELEGPQAVTISLVEA